MMTMGAEIDMDERESHFVGDDEHFLENGFCPECDRLLNCCFPDCGCDGARNCMADNGASGGSLILNREKKSRQPG